MDDKNLIPRRNFLKAAATGFVTALGYQPSSAEEIKSTEKINPSTCGKLFVGGGFASIKEGETSLYKAFHPVKILERLEEECKGRSLKGKTVLVATTGSTSNESRMKEIDKYCNDFTRRGANVIFVENDKLNSTEIQNLIADTENTPLVWFCGGDQDWHVNQWKNTECLKALTNRFETDPDFIIGGNSAGTAAMSELMITSERKDDVYQEYYDRPAFGFTIATLDTHTDRVETDGNTRHIKRISKSKRVPALGLQEGTAALIIGNQVEIVADEDKVVHALITKGEPHTNYKDGDKFSFSNLINATEKNYSIAP